MVPTRHEKCTSDPDMDTRLACDMPFIEKQSGTRRLFEHLHPRILRLLEPFSTFISFISPEFTPRIDPGTYDLRYFWWKTLTSDFDPQVTPSTGFVNHFLFHGTVAVAHLQTSIVDGVSVKTLRKRGDPEILQVAEIAHAYQHVMAIAQHLAGKKRMADFSPTFSIARTTFERLRKHLQFLKLKRWMIEQGYALRFDLDDMNTAHVSLKPLRMSELSPLRSIHESERMHHERR